MPIISAIGKASVEGLPVPPPQSPLPCPHLFPVSSLPCGERGTGGPTGQGGWRGRGRRGGRRGRRGRRRTKGAREGVGGRAAGAPSPVPSSLTGRRINEGHALIYSPCLLFRAGKGGQGARWDREAGGGGDRGEADGGGEVAGERKEQGDLSVANYLPRTGLCACLTFSDDTHLLYKNMKTPPKFTELLCSAPLLGSYMLSGFLDDTPLPAILLFLHKNTKTPPTITER
eukprot:Gb_32068 [translate_table: standard]